jgi:subtilisin family serine protease
VSRYVVDEIIVSPGPHHDRAHALLVDVAAELDAVPVETRRSKDLARVLGDTAYARTPRSFVLEDEYGERVDDPVAFAQRVVRRAKRRARRERTGTRQPDLSVMVNVNQWLSAHDALSGMVPATGGLVPATGGLVPATGGLVPATGGLVPATGGLVPATGGLNQPPSATSAGIASYGVAGFGARQPVDWVGPEPTRRDDVDVKRRPVVVTLDTGVGEHPWLTEDDGVTRGLDLGGVEVGFTDPATDPEAHGVRWGVLDGALDSHSGHGTFIAGLIRQLCPDADIRAVRVMRSDGVADEYELIRCLLVLAEQVRRYRDDPDTGMQVDVVVLSLGYRHTSADDEAYDQLMLPVLRDLGSMGVAVVAAAGNNGWHDEVYPAAFAPHRGGRVGRVERGVVPVTSVGSLNPNGTVALYSNFGPWVRCWAEGASLISTLPVRLRGGLSPVVQVTAGDGRVHSTIDPDDFSAGFGVWSGTSFAAPVVAGRLAQALLDQPGYDDGLTAEQVTEVVRATWKAHQTGRRASPRGGSTR